MMPLRWLEQTLLPARTVSESFIWRDHRLRCYLSSHYRTIKNSTALLATLVLFAGMASAKAHKSTQASSHTKHSTKHSSKTKRAKSKKVRGQRSIDEARARQIQQALVREHYLDGEPSGQWDQRTKDAMQKYQAANGWQTKSVPDSRALIKLGLGPSQANLLNPETAATATAPPPSLPEPSAAGGPSAFRQ